MINKKHKGRYTIKDIKLNELLEFGIINLDKPSNYTSFQAAEIAAKLLGVGKFSHFGTLDPKVTGVLPVALNRACKLTGWFMKKNKTYVGVMKIHKPIDEIRLRQEMNKFVGKIMQMPPIKSRVKRQEREREIYSWEILEKEGRDVLFKVECEAGTYVRKLCLHPNTEILTNRGLIKIKYFPRKPLEVYSLDSRKLKLKKPVEIQKIPSPNKLIKLKMSSGIEIIATPEHKMLISKEEGYKMRECEKLNVGDYIVKSSNLPINEQKYVIADLLDNDYLVEDTSIKELCKQAFIKKFGSIRAMNRKLKLDRKVFLAKSKYAISIKHLKLAGIYDIIKGRLKRFKTQKGGVIEVDRLTKDYFYLLGLIASDGNNTKEKKTRRFTRLKFHNMCEELIYIFWNTYKKLFPTIPISKRIMKDNLFQLDTSNSLFASIAANLGIVSPNKYSDILPVLCCKKGFIKAFLKGYFDGDGNAYLKKKKNSTTTYSRICFFSVNYTNAKRIHQMLLKLGINNKIFLREKSGMYVVDINSLSSKKKFIKEVGANHPKKIEILGKINKMSTDNEIGDENYVGFHYKNYVKDNKAKLSKMGGNLQRVLGNKTPMTRGFYGKCSELIDLPKLDDFIIEKINKIKIIVPAEEYVFDMTVPKTHNFLIETGFVSSNCSDLGLQIGGAHMLELRRVKAGIFSEEDKNFVNLYELKKIKDSEEKLKEIIIPAEEAIKKILPSISIKKEAEKKLLTGKPIFIEDLEGKEFFKLGDNQEFAVFSDRFIGIYKKVKENDILARSMWVMN